jgi:V8-like Glu-specific endopeptidase
MKIAALAMLLTIPAFADSSILHDAVIDGQAVPASSRFARMSVEIIIKYSSGTALCTGTLIGKDTVLSAAHCVKNESTGESPEKVVVLLNPTRNPLETSPKMIEASKFTVHPGYADVMDGSGIRRPIHDLSLLRLDSPVTVGPDAMIADLPTAELPANTDVVLAGYGKTDANDDNSIGKLFFAWTTGSPIRVGGFSNSDTQIRLEGVQPCNGDSGGPVFRATETTAVLVGVTSNVMNNCTVNGTEMSVFSHLSWIKQTAASLGSSIGR